jgi:2-phospho-L-lactate guanylyltransferase
MSGVAWAIVPAKSFARGKSRLRPVLSEDARARFAGELLGHVLGVLSRSSLEGVLVATDGDDVESLARQHGADVLRDRGSPSLAAVVDASLVEVTSRGAMVAVVVMADLPRITPEDVAALLRALDEHDVALVRDHQGHHTNALALRLPARMTTRFGRPDSFDAHLEAARAGGLRVAVVESERIAFDVDLPADHARVMMSPRGAGT